MKNTTFRKKALLSSVAMLLVALVALGSATFAWFTKSSSATADQLSVKTVKSSELELSASSGDWTDNLHYAYTGKVLKPASSADGVNWFSATAAAKTASTAKADTIASISNLDGYVYANQINVRNKGEAAVENVKITFSLSEEEAKEGKYLRLAIVPVDARGADVDPTADNFKAGVFAAGTDSAEAYTYDTDGSTIKTVKVDAKDGTNGFVTVGTLDGASTVGGTSAKFYNLYVWFEGQDTDCKDANAGNIMPEITFTVSGDTVATTE